MALKDITRISLFSMIFSIIVLCFLPPATPNGVNQAPATTLFLNIGAFSLLVLVGCLIVSLVRKSKTPKPETLQ